jgi:hydrogenase nickel incorporation protein HypA/HybF
MHELSIAQNLIEIIEEAASQKNFSKVKKISLRIGEMACVDKEALSFCLEVASKGTCVEGARLLFEDSPLRGKCRSCDHLFSIRDLVFRCPRCEGIDIHVMSGREIRVSYLDVEDGRDLNEKT